MALKMCLAAFERTRKECTDWRDDGYDSCTEWSDDCVSWAEHCVVSWIPIIGPAICKVFEWICLAFEWVCKAAVWIAQWVCHAWNVVKTALCFAVEAVGAALYVVGVIVKVILSIPVIGALIREIINVITSVVIGLVGLVVEGVMCGLLRGCFSKRMRICVIITHDGNERITNQATIQPIIDRMVQIVGSSRVDLQACKLEYSIVSPK